MIASHFMHQITNRKSLIPITVPWWLAYRIVVVLSATNIIFDHLSFPVQFGSDQNPFWDDSNPQRRWLSVQGS